MAFERWLWQRAFINSGVFLSLLGINSYIEKLKDILLVQFILNMIQFAYLFIFYQLSNLAFILFKLFVYGCKCFHTFFDNSWFCCAPSL